MTQGGELTQPGVSGGAGPLAGVRVLELGGQAGDYAGLLCAGLGATVVKVEPPQGSPGRRTGPFYGGDEDPERSLYFWGYNRGKRSVVLDLADADGQARFEGLLAGADVLIDASGVGELARLGIDPGTHQNLVHARVTPFGEDGPWADYATSDLVSLALGGVTMNCGYDPDPFGKYDLPPIAPQAWMSLHIAGEQLVIGIVSALLYRLRSGQGQQVSVAIHQAVATNTEIDLMSWVMMRQPVYRQTARHALGTITNPSMSYTKDGRWNLSMHVGARDQRFLKPFMDRYGLGDGMNEVIPEPVPGVRAVAGSSASATAGVEYVQRLTRRFRYADVPWQEAQLAGLLWSPIRKPEENAADAHWLSRGTFADVEHPELERSLRYPVSKWISTRGSWTAGRRAPLLGEDDKLLQDGWVSEDDQLPPAFRTDAASSVPSGDSPEAAGTGQRASLHAQSRVPSVAAGDAEEGLSALGKPFPLAGVRILDFSWFLASAGATRFLAALGADVLKVEWKTHPDSGRGTLVPDGGRAARDAATSTLTPVKDNTIGGQYNNKNPGKRGLSLNVADPRGLEIAKKLLAKCDVVAEGFSPGVLERWGLGYEEQKKIRPGVIYVKQSGMGAFGTYGRFRAVGPIAAALSGMTEMSGLPTPAPPAGWGYSFLDWFGAYSMALSALYHRDVTGEGQWIDASQTEAGIMLTQVPVLDHAAHGRSWERTGNRPPYQDLAPQGIYRCAGEDRWIAVTCATQAHWEALAAVAGQPGWLTDPRFADVAGRRKHHDELDELITAWTADLEPYELMHRLQAAGIPAGVCQTAGDRVDTDPQLAHLGWLTELDGTRIGRWPLAGMPVKMSATPPYIGGRGNRAAPLYGEDNTAVLTGLLGMSEDEVAALTEQGVL